MKLKLIIQSLLLFLIVSCNTYKVSSEQKRFILFDKNKDKYFLIEYINDNQENQKLGKRPTIIINNSDGQLIIRRDKVFRNEIKFRKKDIRRIEILPKEKSVNLYGAAGIDGVIYLFTF